MATINRAAATRRARTRQEHPPISVEASSVESFPEAELPDWDEDEEEEMEHKMAAGTRLDASMESQVSQKKKGEASSTKDQVKTDKVSTKSRNKKEQRLEVQATWPTGPPWA